MLTGSYVDDELEGPAATVLPSGEAMHCHYSAGIMDGPFKEVEPNGMVRCRGSMRNACRDGDIEFQWPDGGRLRGTVLRGTGQVTGDGFCYTYPDGESVLVGRWEEGQMKCARFKTSLKPPPSMAMAAVYTHDPPTSTRINKHPLLRDPYETCRVAVRSSLVSGANEGLFAIRAMETGEVACFYSGILLTHELVDSRDWAENDNTMSVDDDTVVDVPPPLVPTSKYAATLGHKVNHSFDPNAQYEPFVHPRFGEIKCIRCTRQVREGEEIFCHYDYNEIDQTGELVAPQWFLKIHHASGAKVGR